MRKYAITAVMMLLWFSVGFAFINAIHFICTDTPELEEIPAGGLWTPADKNELPLPEVDMKDAIEIPYHKLMLSSYVSGSMVSVDGLDITEAEANMIKFTNEFRVKNGRKPLIASRRLMGTARLQAWHQTRRGMNHGYTRGWRAENIAAGQSSAREVVNTWINSSGHRANMLGNWVYIGVGGYNNQWSQQFE